MKANLIAISAEVSGRVDRVFVAENTPVKAGQRLFTINSEPFRIEFARAQAELDKVRNLISALRADHGQAQMELKEAQSDIKYYKRVQRRFLRLRNADTPRRRNSMRPTVTSTHRVRGRAHYARRRSASWPASAAPLPTRSSATLSISRLRQTATKPNSLCAAPR